jgi:hypothetical protein
MWINFINAINLILDNLVPRRTREENKIYNQKRKDLRKTYGDQKGQVAFLVNHVLDYEGEGLFRNGFFVDLACADGREINNTYFLEEHLGWTGLLFEPNPYYHDIIKSCRTSKLITDCVTDKVGDLVTFRVDNGMLGGIVSDETDNNLYYRGAELKDAELIQLKTTTLAHELDLAGAPKIIDFMSLDIEGAEWLALKNFTFDKYIFRCIALERPSVALDLLLDKHGYRQVAHLDFDVVYVHKNFLGMVNAEPRFEFRFTDAKNW